MTLLRALTYLRRANNTVFYEARIISRVYRPLMHGGVPSNRIESDAFLIDANLTRVSLKTHTVGTIYVVYNTVLKHTKRQESTDTRRRLRTAVRNIR